MESEINEKYAGLLVLGSMGMLILAGAFVFIYLVYRRKLVSQKLSLIYVEEEHQRELMSCSIESLDNERKRIAGDLHDDIGMSLSTLRLNFNNAMANTGNDIKFKSISAQCKNIIDQSINRLRQISYDLMSPELQILGLKAAVQALTDNIENQSPAVINFSCSNFYPNLNSKTEIMLYRIVQELLNNTIKHANATTIELKIIQNNHDLHLSYNDNGTGFPDDTQKKGLGLLNIESRVKVLKGELMVDSIPGNGVSYEIYIPSVFSNHSMISK